MSFLFGSKKTDSDGDVFVSLIQVAQKDSDFRDQLLNVLALDNFNRKSALNSFVQNMVTKNAPSELIRVMKMLLDDAVAEKVRRMLENA